MRVQIFSEEGGGCDAQPWCRQWCLFKSTDIKNNSVKRKAMRNLCERPHKLITKNYVASIWIHVHDSEKTTRSCKNSLHFFNSINGLYVDGTFKSAPKFFHQIFTFHGLTMGNLHFFFYQPINIQRPMSMYSDIWYQRLQNVVRMFLQELFMLTSKRPFTTQWQQCGQAGKLKHVDYI